MALVRDRLIKNAMKASRILVHVRISVIVFVGALFFGGNILSVQATLYAPGATLDPTCLPTDLNCGVQSLVASGTVGQIAYYAADGKALSATSSLITTSTSTFAGLNIATLGLRVGALNTSDCDLKATTDGTFYCGTDAAGGSPTWGSITGTLSSQSDLQTALNLKIDNSTTSLPLLGSLTGLGSIGSSTGTTTFAGGIIGPNNFTLQQATGNVGIGTTSPFTALSVNGTIYATGWNFFGTSATGVTGTTNIVLANSPTLSQPIFQGPRGGTGASSFMSIRGTTNATFTSGGYISFEPYNATEVARITPLGNFGIGTTSPQRKLHITNDGSLSQMILEATSSVADQHYWGFQASSTGAFVLNSLTDGLVSSNRFMLDANGKVAIGTSTATAFLNVLGTTEQLRLSYDASNYASFTTASNGALTIGTTPGASGVTVSTILTVAGLRTMSTANQSNLAVFAASGVSNFNIAALNLVGATSTDVRVLMRGSTNGTLTSNASYASLNIGQQAVTENASGNHPLLSQLALRPLAVTAGAATVDNTATLYIEDAASATVGTGNYALWIDNGISRFDGNVGVGTSSPATALDVNGTITQLAQKGCSTGLTTDALGSINGCVASDERLKKNIESLTLSLDALNKLSPVTYEWKDENRDTQIHAGFIAQEVEKVLPQAVVSAGNGFKGIDPNAILALVVRAIQGFAQSITTVVLNATTVKTQELCVDGTCITGNQLRQILEQSDQQSVPATISVTPSVVQSITTPSDTSSTTGEATEATSTENTSTTTTITTVDTDTTTNETPDIATASSTSQ
jgi:hypothetical protein